METQEVAEKITSFIFSDVFDGGSEEFAIQLFFENLLLNKNVEDYTKEYLRDNLIDFITRNKLTF